MHFEKNIRRKDSSDLSRLVELLKTQTQALSEQYLIGTLYVADSPGGSTI
jgi:hypothetical protein